MTSSIIAARAKSILEREGRTQTWTARRMNEIDDTLNIDRKKLSATLTGRRKMSGDELLAYCKALEISPNEFCNDVIKDEHK